MRVVPDGLTGAIMAVEGISDAAVLLHGPGGCRVRHMVLSSAVYQRADEGQPFDPFYYGYPRVPATYLDEYDYIHGAYRKSEEGLGAVGSRSPSLIAVVDSPGAALIGDDHGRAVAANGLEGVAMVIPDAVRDMPATAAVGETLREAMGFLGAERTGAEEGTVALLGLSLLDKDWRAARDELSWYLRAMGLDVVCAPGAGSSTADMIRSANAEYAVVVCPEMCAGLTEWYAEQGAEVVRSPAGAPVGFDALEAWIRTVAEAAGRDPEGALRRVLDAREDVRMRFEGIRYNALRIRGQTFSAAGTASVVRPLTEWLYSYMSMAPVAVKVDDGADPDEAEALRSFLDRTGFPEAWDREPVDCGTVLCEGVTALTMRLQGRCRSGVPIGYSSMGLDDIIPRPVYGVQGARFILDEILHGVRTSRRRTLLLLRSQWSIA